MYLRKFHWLLVLSFVVSFIPNSVAQQQQQQCLEFVDSCGINRTCDQGECKCRMGYLPHSELIEIRPTNPHRPSPKYSCNYSWQCPFADANFQCIDNFCKCDHGYELDYNSMKCINRDSQCELLSCSRDQDCWRFPNSKCNPQLRQSSCVCETGYTLDSKSLHCKLSKATTLKRDTVFPFSCTQTVDCGQSSVCISNRCQCRMGHIFDQNMNDCLPHSCFTDADCLSTLNSQCNSSTRRCECASNYRLNESSQQCQSSSKSCVYDYECGSNAVCSYGICKCHLGFKSPWIEKDGCNQVVCTSHDDCRSQFNGTRCNFEQSLCECDDDHRFNRINQTCILIVESTTHSSRECTNNMDCPANKICDIWSYVCACSLGTYWNANSNLCERNGPIEDDTGSTPVGLIIGIVFGLIIVAALVGGLVWCCRKKSPPPQIRAPVQPQVHQSKAVPSKPQHTIVHSNPKLSPSAPSPSPNMSRHVQPQLPTYWQPSYNPAYPPNQDAQPYPNTAS